LVYFWLHQLPALLAFKLLGTDTINFFRFTDFLEFFFDFGNLRCGSLNIVK
jgi:hypothetical protein